MTVLPRMGLVGLGMAVTPHAEAYRDLANRVTVAAAFAPSEARRRAFAERFGFPVVDTLEAILDDPTIAAVGLQTPPNTHLDLVCRCAAAGKHVLLEKPLEIDTERAAATVAACEAAGVTLGVMLQHRFRPSGLELRRLLNAGALGAVTGGQVSILNWRPQAYYDEPGRGEKGRDGGGVLLTQGIHTLDLLTACLGLPEAVHGLHRTTPVHVMETEDLAGAVMRYPNGAIVTLTATTAAYPGFPERITLFCEKGTADLVGTTLRVRYLDGREETFGEAIGAGGTGADPMAFPSDYHRALIADFVEAIREGRPPAVTGQDALEAHRLIDRILAG
ncbi:MAG: Gfo/Idh/MocA family oxidoreductase [Rhodobacterales bacterium]|nr:Gfo/Idh/MocA family oxidoreductase [Rhodobacterales bacterium]